MSRFLEAAHALQGDPVGFVKEFFGAEPEPFQGDVMQSVAEGHRGISVKSSPGVGKTTLLSWTAIWWITVYRSAKAAVTAPSSGQINDAFLPEMKSWIRAMPEEVQQFYIVKSDRVEFGPYPELNFMSVKTSRVENPDAMQGVHAEHVILIGDEASGIPEQVFEAASASSMANPHACMLLTGNPVRSTGYFYDTFDRLTDSWVNFTINAFDSKRVTDEYIEECRIRYGEDSNTYRIRVLAEFPSGDDDTVIPIELLQSAIERDIHPYGHTVWGVDIARMGDNKSALCKRRSNAVIEPVKLWAGLDGMEVVGRVEQEYEITPTDKRPEAILIDSVGVGGPVGDRLRQLNLPAQDINVGEVPSMKDRYVYLRDQLWWQGRQWLEGRDVSLPDCPTLKRELPTVRYRYLPSNKIRVETKDEMRKRGVKSPDGADAFILTFAAPAVIARHGRKYSRGKPLKRRIKGVT